MTTHYLHNKEVQIAFQTTEDPNKMYITFASLNSDYTHTDAMSVEEARELWREVLAQDGHKGMAQLGNEKVNVKPILDTLNHALAHGVKSPRMSVEGFCFKLGKPGSKNPGWVYVNESSEWGSAYYGKISPNGDFQASYDAPADVAARLVTLAADVVAAAKAYGRSTGSCSFCARTLTHKSSIALSYGPICAEKYGFPHEYEVE